MTDSNLGAEQTAPPRTYEFPPESNDAWRHVRRVGLQESHDLLADVVRFYLKDQDEMWLDDLRRLVEVIDFLNGSQR